MKEMKEMKENMDKEEVILFPPRAISCPYCEKKIRGKKYAGMGTIPFHKLTLRELSLNGVPAKVFHLTCRLSHYTFIFDRDCNRVPVLENRRINS